ncbi:unnamed protein product, partial [Hymenolepis diminuta]
KYICAHVLVWPYPSDSYKTVTVFFHSQPNTRILVTGSYAFLSSPPFLSALLPSLSLSLASILVVVPLNTFWLDQLLVFYSTIVVSFYPNSYDW